MGYISKSLPPDPCSENNHLEKLYEKGQFFRICVRLLSDAVTVRIRLRSHVLSGSIAPFTVVVSG